MAILVPAKPCDSIQLKGSTLRLSIFDNLQMQLVQLFWIDVARRVNH